MHLRPIFRLAFAISLIVLSRQQSIGSTVYSTGFELPEFSLGPFVDQGGWTIGGSNGAIDIVSFSNGGVASVQVDAALAGTTQTGIRHDQLITADTVRVEADIFLSPSSNSSAWQFAAIGPGEPNANYIAGINPLPNGQLQVITPGFPSTANGLLPRNQWNNVALDLDFTSQTYDVIINSIPTLSDIPFLTGQTQFAAGVFNTFGGGDETGFADNYIVSAVPESSSLLAMLGFGLASALRMRNRRNADQRWVANVT